MDLFYPDLPELVRRLREMRAQHKDLDVRLHFLATEDPEGGFVARGGTAAVEEFKRLACAEALSADKMFDYLACRADAKDSGWWEACAREAGIDAGQLQRCAAGPEGERALRAKTALTNELDIALGPTLLVGNRDVYFVVKVPSLEELEEILKPGQATDENK